MPGTLSTPLAMVWMAANWFPPGPDAPHIVGGIVFAAKPGHIWAMFRVPGQEPSGCSTLSSRESTKMHVCSRMLPVTPVAPGTITCARAPVGLQPAADVHVVVEASTTVAGATARP